ncbi:DHA2 family efflux MFS transporter permease subunit [Conexibacter stalactiti]|uniref:DHA2 family efflux MFS transporter permease subunit n=1 Tax=Conexibacter stalactiti TaxID=1940611 RepID=A0ABU4HHV9_9ACTN|nr:DHA2 family efflux MFS transporter permease subunit [Conexibacter stalactiti]MDW5592883.1 DHA2 family efflux MFS transporter permease subunit [Conexibacter stalactiti]MEC5033524.1 DHA2 family efflux MFS transporter permease subunit [Conexibacter stalactiti]
MSFTASSPEAPPATRPRVPEPARPGPAIAVASAATFVAFLDVTVVNVALPDLQRDFPGDSLVALSWVVAIYGVLFAALLTPAGRLADVVGRKTVFLGGFAAFTLTSALCALAPSVPLLIALRALQGASAAFMIPAALGIVLAVSRPEKRAAAVGLWGATTSIAAALGPALGGLLIDGWSWRAVFLINVPIGLAVLWAGWRLLPSLRRGDRQLPDLLGSLLLAAGFALVLVALTETAQWGWLDGRTFACALAGLLLLAVVWRRTRTHAAPAVDTTLWRNRVYAAASVGAALYGVALFAWMLACVLFVTGVWGYSIVEAGLAITPGAFSSAVAAVLAGRAVERHGPAPVVAIGSLLFAAAGVWCVLGIGETPEFLAFWLPLGIVGGAGMGSATVGLTAAGARALPPEQFAAGTGLLMTARQLGGALGVAALAAILDASDGGLGGFRGVFAMCTAATVLTAISALWLRRRPAAGETTTTTTTTTPEAVTA